MGLAAGQARLLSITGRKSDCEFESMRLSHQKIALARELADLSNEYQNSLNQTKLIYDYYGTGDTSTQLSYGLLMYPSALNNYMPTILTDSLGRVTLNSKYAAAARAAGIPQEGLGTLPSEDMRNAFIRGLAQQGLITEKLANTITNLPYNQAAGFGGGATVAVMTEQGNYSAFVDMLKDNNGTAFTHTNTVIATGKSNKDNNHKFGIGMIVDNTTYPVENDHTEQMTLAQLLSDEHQYYLEYNSPGGEQTPVIGLSLMQDYLGKPGGFIDWLVDEFSAVLDLGDGYTAKALEYAETKTREIYTESPNLGAATDNKSCGDYWYGKIIEWGWSLKDQDSEKFSTNEGGDKINKYINAVGTSRGSSKNHHYDKSAVTDSQNYIGFTFTTSKQEGWHDDGYDDAAAGVNLNNIAKVFLTYFADYMNGISETNSDGSQVFDINFNDATKRHVASNHMSQNNQTFEYVWKIGSEVSSDDLGQATFYDMLFNQICANGWTENNKINDNEYLQQMLQNGMMFISRVKDDNYYYQGNYATDTYIKEIADETLIAYAESKYNTEKAKLNAKEETLDLKMKNLDTEISSLTTEYDTVKNTISKNIEKSFKRYSA